MEVVEKEKVLIPKLRFTGFEEGWKLKKLADVGNIITGSTPSTSNPDFYEGDYLFVSPADIGNSRIVKETKTTLTELGFSKGRKIKKGSVLFVSIGSTIGKVGIAGRNLITNQQINSIEADENNFNDFIFEILQKKGRYIKSLAGVQAVPLLNKTDFSCLKFNFPTLPEQQKIASFLSAVDEKIQQLRQKKALLEKYKKGVMQKLFPKKAGQAPELRFKPVQTETSGKPDGSNYPDWEEKKLGEVAIRNSTKNKNNSVNYVLTNSATRGVVGQADYFERDIANQNNLQGYYVVEVNDFVYNPRISVHAPVGPIKRNKLARGVMSPLYSVFRFDNDNLEFFERYFETIVWHKYLESVSNIGARHDRMNITNTDFFKMPIPYPCDEERKKIADFLSGIDQKINQAETQINQTQTFKKGLLQQMFV